MKVMVVEDDAPSRRIILRVLGEAGIAVEAIDDPAIVLAHLDAGTADWDVLLLDVGLPKISGIEVLGRFTDAGSLTAVVMLTGDHTAATATTCMRAGAFHYLTKPFQPHEMRAMIESAGRYAMLRRELAGVRQQLGDVSSTTLVGTSAAMRELRATIGRLADRDTTILLQGESGTGKELVARALHDRGARRSNRFIALNCGAIPESLIDSELFGHARGAFTGATADRPGVFVEADGGTLLLDEIGDMPLAVQARLLRVLQESEVRPVGSSTSRKVNVRVIAATHVDLAAAVAQQRFRQDLYYRLDVVRIAVPALRERLDDLPLLVAHLLRKHAGDKAPSLTTGALARLADHPWPGNVRELENALMHAVALHHGDVIGVDSLPAHIGPQSRRAELIDTGPDPEELTLSEAKRLSGVGLERRYLIRVMTRSKGSVSEAARLAGVDRTNFRRMLHRNGIDPAEFK